MKNHVVNKVSVRLPASDYENARNLQQNAQQWSSLYLPGLLEKTLDEVSKNGEYYFIDTIEIEITKYPWLLSADEWKQKITQKIRDSRFSKLPADVILKQWVFYLQNGTFEKNAIIKNIQEFEIWFLKVGPKFSGLEHGFTRPIFYSESSIKRLFLAHSENFTSFILEHFLKVRKEKARHLYRLIKTILMKNQQIAFEFIKKLNSLVLQNKSGLKEKLIDTFLQNPETKEIDKIESKKRTLKENPQSDESEKETEVLLHCENAGLVLLLPFIKPFFENVGLLKDDVFTDEISKLKACNVLHFLATGKKAEDEAELLLPKILCGIEIQEYVEPVEIQDDNIKNETDDLLKSVIQHWEVLKNTSVDSLRETFLQRDGQLKIESAFILQVSNSGVDILLSKLPWGFRNYKLPWMQKTIITEWH